ncbi:MAG TPA: pyrimidine reductase family protein [Mycobacteriales bacterium]|nr:pyrimidine reductase family protein [Mycobacteriales bacterium]
MPSAHGIAELPDTPDQLARFYGDPPEGVRANMVLTPDGAGAFRGRTKAITDPADQTLLNYLRGLADAVMVGSATVLAEHYGPVELPQETKAARRQAGYTDEPPLVVVTARANLPVALPIFDPSGPRTIVATLASGAKAAAELQEVADVMVVGEDAIDPARILAELADRGLRRVLCEGGPFLLSRLVEHDLVDEMCLTLSPYLAGSQPTTMQPASSLLAPTRLSLRHVLMHDDLLYLRYARG